MALVALTLGAAGRGAEVVVELAARPAGAHRAAEPVVVLLAVADDALGGDANLAPQVERLVVVQVDGGPEALLGHGEPVLVGHQFPGPGDGFLLEVVTDAEVAQHLEEGEVGGVADRVDVAGTEALLHGGQAPRRRGDSSLEVGLELHHASAGEQQTGIAPWHERCAGYDLMLALLEEAQESVADLLAVHT